MTYTNVTHESYGSRIQGSIAYAFFGLFLFIGSFFLLSWNEGRTIKTTIDLDYAKENYVAVDSKSIDKNNEGKIIYLSGKPDNDTILSDSIFNLSVNAIRLKRVVEMYQWVEEAESKTREKMGGEKETITTYTYIKQWRVGRVESENFQQPKKYANPYQPFNNESYQSNNVYLGKYILSEAFIKKMSFYTDLPLSNSVLYRNNKSNIVTDKNNGEINKNTDMSLMDEYSIEGNYIYKGDNISTPNIGDIRVSFKIVKPKNITIIGQQNKNNILPYQASYINISFLQEGLLSAEELFRIEKDENIQRSWLIRLGGIVLIFVSLKCIISPIRTLFVFVPFIANIFGFLSGLILFIISLILGLTTILIAWFAYRPLLSLIIALISLALFFVLIPIIKAKRKKLAAIPEINNNNI